MKNEKGTSKKFVFLIVSICVFCLIFLIISCVIFFNREDEVKKEKKDGGSVTLSYTDDINIFSLTNATPLIESVGKTLDSADMYFDFTVDAELDEAKQIDYEIYVEKYGNTPTIKDEDIRFYLEKQNSGTFEEVLKPVAFTGLKEKSELGTPRGAMVIYSDSVKNDKKENYRLRMWLADTAIVSEAVPANYSVKVSIVGKAK